MTKQNMESDAIGLIYEMLLEWVDGLEPDANHVSESGDMAAKIVDEVLDSFGIEYEPEVNGQGNKTRGASIFNHERLAIRARPGSQFRIVANDAETSFSNSRRDVLVDLVFHAFGDRVSNTTIYMGARSALAPSIPTVAYWGDKPVLRKFR